MIEAEIKKCQNCHKDFQIEPDDFDFYKKVSVPPPTFCPECRRQRRMSWRNERTLYKRKCNAPGHKEDIISVYSPDKLFTVYDDKYWWSDQWDPFSYGRDYDFSKPFFQQFRELLERVPLINLSITNMSNCSYCNVAEGDKDCYLISASEHNERVRYSNHIVRSKDSQDIYIGDNYELSYEAVNCAQCYHCMFSFKSNQCRDCAFVFDCTNCNDCFMCSNLRNKSYCIWNKQFSKEDYKLEMQKYDLGSYEVIKKLRHEYTELLKKSIHRFGMILKSTQVTGDAIIEAKNVRDSFDIFGPAKDCRFLWWSGVSCEDAYDSLGVGFSAEQLYECVDTGIKGSKLYFTNVVYGSTDVYYSINCHGSKNLFGCYGIRGSEYCVLNKRYQKEEYKILISKIREHMGTLPYVAGERVYRFGEYFPTEISPFCYNEAIAQEYFPLKREEAIAHGLTWKDSDERSYQITKKTADLADHIRDVPDSIIQDVIECEHAAALWKNSHGYCGEQCSTAFRLTPDELAFYRHMNLPLPRLCFNCRQAARVRMRNPMKLWHRKCQCGGAASENSVYKNTVAHAHGAGYCPNEFETTYAPERPEIVYCEACYQSEVI